MAAASSGRRRWALSIRHHSPHKRRSLPAGLLGYPEHVFHVQFHVPLPSLFGDRGPTLRRGGTTADRRRTRLRSFRQQRLLGGHSPPEELGKAAAHPFVVQEYEGRLPAIGSEVTPKFLEPVGEDLHSGIQGQDIALWILEQAFGTPTEPSIHSFEAAEDRISTDGARWPDPMASFSDCTPQHLGRDLGESAGPAPAPKPRPSRGLPRHQGESRGAPQLFWPDSLQWRFLCQWALLGQVQEPEGVGGIVDNHVPARPGERCWAVIS